MNARILFLIIIFLLLSGCATILKGPNDHVNIYTSNETKALNSDGTELPFTQIDSGHKEIILKSVESYNIRFSNNISKINIEFNSHLQAGWLILDILGYGVPVLVDAASENWKVFDDVELVFLPKSSDLLKETGLQSLPLSYNLNENNDPKLDIILNKYRPRPLFFEKYAASTLGWIFGMGATIGADILIFQKDKRFKDINLTNSIMLGAFIIAPIFSAGGVTYLGDTYIEHGSFWHALGGSYVGVYAASTVSLALLIPAIFAEKYNDTYLYSIIAISAFIPPLFTTLLYNASLPDLFLIPYGSHSSSLFNYSAPTSAFRLLPPSLSIERNPFFPNEFITKFNFLKINF